MRNTIKLEGVTGNGSNGVMELRMPAGLKYFNLHMIRQSGTIAIGTITQIRMILGQDAVWDLTGQELDELNKEEGLTAYDGTTLLLPMTLRGNMKETLDTNSTALNVGVTSPSTGKAIVNAKLQVTFAGATNPQVDFYADFMPATAEGPGVIKRLRRFGFTGAAGENSVTTLPFATPDVRFISRMGLTNSGGVISEVRLTKTKAGTRDEFFRRVTAGNSRSLVDGGRVVGAFFDFMIDFREQGMLDIEDTNGWNAFEAKPTLDLAGDLAFLMEQLGTL